MKLIKFSTSILFVAAFMLWTNHTQASPNGPHANWTGSPLSSNACVACHTSFPLNSGAGNLMLTGLPTSYTQGSTYPLSITLSDPQAMRWGFQVTALDPLNGTAGSLQVTDSVNTQLNLNVPVDLIMHTFTGTHAGTPNSGSWTFDWIAPNNDDGATFYFAGNAANNNGFTTGDYIYTQSVSIPSASVSDFEVMLTYNSGSPVPAGGGFINFAVFLQNNEPTSQNFDLWIEIPPQIAPPGVPNRNLTFPSGFSITRPGMNWPISASWPAGYYLMVWKIGDLANLEVWAQDNFSFYKSAVLDDSGFMLREVEGDPLDQLFDQTNAGESTLVNDFALLGAYPNPFNPTTTISYQLSADSRITLAVYDINGRLMSQLVDGWRHAGRHEAFFDASDLTSGVYLYRLTAGDHTASGKMVLMK